MGTGQCDLFILVVGCLHVWGFGVADGMEGFVGAVGLLLRSVVCACMYVYACKCACVHQMEGFINLLGRLESRDGDFYL